MLRFQIALVYHFSWLCAFVACERAMVLDPGDMNPDMDTSAMDMTMEDGCAQVDGTSMLCLTHRR